MSSDEKKVVKLDEEKHPTHHHQESIKPNEKEEEIGLLSKPMSKIVKVPTNPKIFSPKKAFVGTDRSSKSAKSSDP